MLKKALSLLKIFKEKGYEAYVVGGFVRDLILKRESMDVDICTNATPKQIKDIFDEVKLPFEQYGAVNLKFKKVNFEITTYRMELGYNNGRTPSKILYTNNLIVDLKRRDFTINTLCIDYKGKIVDLLDGINDINKRLIRTVGDANVRLEEDSLRILRAIRFATELDFNLDEELKDAIIANRDKLNKLSFFRKKQELNRIFSSVNGIKGLKLIKDFQLEDYLGIKINDNVIKTSDPIGVWAQVDPCDKYQFTSNEKEYLKKIKSLIQKNYITDYDIYKNGNYVCYIVAQILKIDEIKIYDRYDELQIKKQSDIDFNGKEIIDLLKPKDKSMVKDVINSLEYLIVNNKLNNNKEDIRKYLIDTYDVL